MNKACLAAFGIIACLLTMVSIAEVLDPAKPYNIVVFEDSESKSYNVEGRISAVGNLNGNHHSIGDSLSSMDSGVALLIGGDIVLPGENKENSDTLDDGGTYGIGQSARYRLSNNTVLAKNIQPPQVISVVQTKREQLSSSLTELPVSRQKTLHWGGQYLCASCDETLQVVNLDGSQIYKDPTISLDCNCSTKAATYLFNLTGTHSGLSNMSSDIFENIPVSVPHHSPATKSLKIQGNAKHGSILGPRAHISQPQGNLSG